MVELLHEVSSGLFSLFSPFDPSSNGHGFRVGSFEYFESVCNSFDGCCVRVSGSLEFVQPICKVTNAFCSFGLVGFACFLAICFDVIFDVIPLVGFPDWWVHRDDSFYSFSVFFRFKECGIEAPYVGLVRVSSGV